MWQIEYSQEANNYALDSHPYNEAVLMAIEDLADSPNGLPPNNYRRWKLNHYLWQVAGHYVLLQRISFHARRLRILVIKPLP